MQVCCAHGVEAGERESWVRTLLEAGLVAEEILGAECRTLVAALGQIGAEETHSLVPEVAIEQAMSLLA